MRTINSEFIRSYDKFKEDVFHSQKQQHKQKLRNSMKKPQQAIKLRKIFPWKTIRRLTVLGGLGYYLYLNRDEIVNKAIRNGVVNVMDLKAMQVVKQDFKTKLMTLFYRPYSLKQLSSLANNMYRSQLEKDLMYLKKLYPTHKLKGTLQTQTKIWLFQFGNRERCQYINQFGDVIERQQNSAIRVWNYAFLKQRKEKVLEEEKMFNRYRHLMQGRRDKIQNANEKQSIENYQPKDENRQKDLQTKIIKREISSQCQRINILNRFNSKYDELLLECSKNEELGGRLGEIIRKRKLVYPYSELRAQGQSHQN